MTEKTSSARQVAGSVIARENPDRIRAVIMHDVTPEDRDAEALVAMNELKELGIPAIYTDS